MPKATRRVINYDDFEEIESKSEEDLLKENLEELEAITKLYSDELQPYEKKHLKMFELVGSGIRVEAESYTYINQLTKYAPGMPTLARKEDIAYAAIYDADQEISTGYFFEGYVREAGYLRKLADGNFRNQEEKEKMGLLEDYRRCSYSIRKYIKNVIEESKDGLIPEEVANLISMYNVNKELLVTDSLTFKEDGLYINRIYGEETEKENDKIMGIDNNLYEEETAESDETTGIDTSKPMIDENTSDIDEEESL